MTAAPSVIRAHTPDSNMGSTRPTGRSRSANGRHARVRSDPLIVTLEFHLEQLVAHAQRSVRAAEDGIRSDRVHLLRHDADIGLVTAVVAETVEAETVVEITEQRDVVFDRDVGAASATTASTAAARSAATRRTHAGAAAMETGG